MKNVKRMAMMATLLVFLGSPLLTYAEKPGMGSDTWTQAKLLTTIALNRELSIFDVNVDVANGVATLTGEVDSEVRKELASEIAKSVEGIREVQNNIRVVPEMAERPRKEGQERTFGETISDLTTTASIKAELLANSNVHGLSVSIETHKSHVTLTGKVPSTAERELVEQIAKNTSGVSSVENKIEVVTSDNS